MKYAWSEAQGDSYPVSVMCDVLGVSPSGYYGWRNRKPSQQTEWVHGKRYTTREEAKLDVFKYIELFYNRKRRHAALGYLSPAAYEQQHLQSKTQQAA